MEERLRPLVERIWRYHHMNHELREGRRHHGALQPRHHRRGTGRQMFLEGWAPLLVFSGGLGSITRHLWSDPEANRFARIAMGMGVPEGPDPRSRTDRRIPAKTCSSRGSCSPREEWIPPQFILVQKPYMERRTFATFNKVWPGKILKVTSPQLSMDDYLARYIARIAVGRRGHQHHGGRSAADSRVPGARLSDPAGHS